ncbi:ribonuclease III [Brachyspira hyodysenteriae]|uniref:Ribonuclease 3 n=2 Tax=Brachyspira hyodysenteriae TaxID=159 RepID=A0A3B6VMP4_BRAHW|nr:ribonuclease III [Brachyspira hyodysenteriae]ACN85116.1 ribonuclease III [Brachyspira hyodysenteriae WA1]ANN62857.1 ribonuclease III [Brachyspira hyodysenteriae ATCC 27164]KLI13434.1 ribonuclease III [Brachyspira hyodysenteriae]KLI18013.1 ribonuclease III [Brachyspira hyodysenteriae]KLI19747.1 ribonuclease III [Brachyspira hyodysenteriae]
MNIDKILNNCQTALKYEFRNKDHLLEAITHRTYANESKKKMKYNQRLEFLGDSVLSLIISDYLFKKYSSSKEGLLSKVKSSLVSQKSLADISKELKLGDFLLLGHGEEASGGRYRDNMLEDLFEAIVGAIYLDSGITSASKFVMRAYKERLKNLDIENFDKDYKTIFQELIQKKHKTSPIYKSYEYYDNNHEMFKSEVYVNDKNFALGVGKSKKEAETNAAKKALDKIEMASIAIKKNKKANK